MNLETIDLKTCTHFKTTLQIMKREKRVVIIEDINSTDDVEHIVLENDVFIDDNDDKKDVAGCCCCFNKRVIKYFLGLLSYYLD